jgi:glycosyltransferase involved in cell wall biosynthesis
VLWIINHYAALPLEPGGTRHYWLARGLQDLGWDVRLIRCGPQAQSHRSPDIEDVDGLEVTTIHGPPSLARGARRVAGWAEFAALLQGRRMTGHLPTPDTVLGSTVHLGAAWAARRLANRHDANFVFEVRDLWPETLIAMGALKRRSLPAQAMLRLEGSLARSAQLVVSPLSGVGRYMSSQHGIPLSRFLWVSNGVNVSKYNDVPPPASGPLKLQYFGSIGTANDVGLIVDGVTRANQLLDEPVQLQIRGNGPGLEVLAERVERDRDLQRMVIFESPVPSTRVPDAMGWGNAVVLAVRDLPELYKYGISMNKLFDYLASGRWIIMASGSLDNPIAVAPGLTVCDPSAESLGAAISTVASMDPARRDALASGNAELARTEFDYGALAARLNCRLKASAEGV